MIWQPFEILAGVGIGAGDNIGHGALGDDFTAIYNNNPVADR